MIWISTLRWSAYQNILEKSYQKEDKSKLERKEWFWTEINVSLRRLLIYTSSFIFALFKPKVYRMVFKKSSYQFTSRSDTFRHKFHYHIRFNVLHLIKYSIYLFFQILEWGWGRCLFKESYIITNIYTKFFEVIRYLISPMHNRVMSVCCKANIANYSL